MTELLSLPDLPANLASGAQLLAASPGPNGSVAYKIALGSLQASAGGGAGYAPLASPALTGVPTAPTAAAGTSTVQIATTAFVASGFVARSARTVTAAGAVSVLPTDGTLFINKTVGAATTVTLEPSPVTGVLHVIKDARGDAASNPITLRPASGTIDGAASFVLSVNYGAISVVFNGTEWSVI